MNPIPMNSRTYPVTTHYNIAICHQSGRACHETPLTGRRYLARRGEELTPVSEAKNSLARLAAYLRNAKPQPSRDLLKLFT